jgi:hypothetical protein
MKNKKKLFEISHIRYFYNDKLSLCEPHVTNTLEAFFRDILEVQTIPDSDKALILDNFKKEVSDEAKLKLIKEKWSIFDFKKSDEILTFSGFLEKLFSRIEKISKSQNIISWRDKKNTDEDLKKNQKNYFGFCGLKRYSNIFIKEIIYQNIKKFRVGEDFHSTQQFNLFVGELGKGNLPLILYCADSISLGDNKLFLKCLDSLEIEDFLNEMDFFGLEILCKILKIKTWKFDSKDRERRTREEIIVDLLNLENIFFEPSLPIPREELIKNGNPFKKIKEILTDNISIIDEDLLTFYIAGIPEVNPLKISPQKYMPFSNHQIITTSGGVGKTFLSQIISSESGFEKSSEAGLLGFSDAKNKCEGRLHNRIKQAFVEELQEEKNEELFGKLHSLMENGRMSIIRGLTIDVASYSGLTFQGNGKLQDEQNLHLKDFLTTRQFINFLDKISSNCEPFGRRISAVFFNQNCKKLVGRGQRFEDEKQQILRSYALAFRDEFTQLFENGKIYEWLNQEFSNDYKKILDGFIENTDDRKLKDFLRGQKASYRHAKGTALRLAFLDEGLTQIFKYGEIRDFDFIISCEENLKKILNINIKSFERIVSSLSSGCFNEILKYKLVNLQPDYVKYGFYTFLEWSLNNPQNKDLLIPLIAVENFYSEVKEKFFVDHNNRYRSFSRVKESFFKFYKNVSILKNFGCDFDTKTQSFIILEKEKLKSCVEIYKVTKDTNDTKNKQEEKKLKSQKTQMTQKTQNNENSVTFVTRDTDFPKKNLLKNVERTKYFGECSICGSKEDVFLCSYKNVEKIFCESCFLKVKSKFSEVKKC